MKAAPTVPMTVKLETKIKNRLKKLAKTKHRTTHWLMKAAVISYLEQEEHTEQLKQETLSRWEEAFNGKVVSNESMMEWLDTWGTQDERDRPPCGS